MYVPNTGAPKYIRKFLEDIKKGIDSNTLIAGDFNIPLLTMEMFQTKNQQGYCGIEQHSR